MIRPSRIGITHASLAVFAVAIIAKAGIVQLADGAHWRMLAARQQTVHSDVPAPRGEMLDATGRILAESRDVVRLEIAPREVNEPRKLRLALEKLHVDRALITRVLDTSSKYTVIPGRFLALDAAPATALHGVHAFSAVERSYAASAGAQGIIGHVGPDAKGVDGLEASLDSILRGTPGTATIFRDSHGQSRESPTAPGTAPIPGANVKLTINADLQEIAETSLAEAVAKMGAEGGDIVIMDPHTGEVLAIASRRLDPKETPATALTEPFEPGSTAKPFMAAALIDRGKVTERDSVDTGDGVFEINGREIHDEHRIGRAPLSEVLRWSSNIGIVKFSLRLSEREEYETLRDFGFGAPTGVPYPESWGTLRPPSQWSKQSANSMAMGYEIAATPLQLAAAYSVFANGGELIEPALVKEIDSPDGRVVYQHVPRVVRRVVSQRTADKVRRMLLDVVDEGTALQAALDNYMLAGKTGTPRAAVKGHYVQGRYNPNFVSMFPGDNPQYVMVVKLTAPHSSIFAAETAAPVTKAIIQTAVAAKNAALDRAKLASSFLPSKKDTHVVQSGTVAPPVPPPARQLATTDTESDAPNAPFVVTLPTAPAKPAARTLHEIPDVRGMVLRDAVRSLHNAGFHVQLDRGAGGSALATSPAAGSSVPTGSLVRIQLDH